jgi:hypothetical protein
MAFIGLLLNQNFSPNYIIVFLAGAGFWVLCLLAVHQIKLSVEENSIERLHGTILIFFIINAIISIYTIGHIIWEIKDINPYRYQGEYQKYFLGTGDYIKGVTFDISTTNAVLNAFGVVYFLTRKNAVMMLVCMVVLLLTASNFFNIALVLVLVLLFLFKSTRDQKSLIIISLMFLVVFMAKVSPQNSSYIHETIKNIIHPFKPGQDSAFAAVNKTNTIAGPDDIKRKLAHSYIDSVYTVAHNNDIKPAQQLPVPVPKTEYGRILIPGADINTPPYQTPIDTTEVQRRMLSFIEKHKSVLALSGQTAYFPELPGKAISFVQTVKFLEHHPAKMVMGDGMGNFSSKLAFKATGFGLTGGFPAKYIYIGNDFLLNHLDVYLNFFSKRAELHSLTNSPFSVYDQMLAEYGIIGLAVFLVFYIGFFTKHIQKLTYGIPLLVLLIAAFFTDYWFEQLSVIVFFELLLLIDIKEAANLKPVAYGNK